MDDLVKILEDADTLISPPDIWYRFNETVHDPKSNISDVADIVKTDPSLVANILKIVNSPYYGIFKKVDTISRAITIIGIDDMYNIVTAVSAVNVFSKIASDIVKPATFWRHSFCTAILSRKIAKYCNVLHTERLYVSGLLHDIGSLLLYSRYPEICTDIIQDSEGDEEKVFQLEAERIGYTHADIGAALLSKWGLPNSIIQAVKMHHTPCDDINNILDASIVHLANCLSNCYILGTFQEKIALSSNQPDPCIYSYIKLPESGLGDIYEDVEDELSYAISLLIPYTI